ncbi:CHAT domain-containing protein [Alkalinema pantanalense CENA528]|uniref:CHAT domain-containing protein n=1 Tax=Alkalinema pantanalense TaxID=1620705 RepID=UPI003D6DE685
MQNRVAGWVAGLLVGTTAVVAVDGLPSVAQTVAPTIGLKKALADQLLEQGKQYHQTSQFEAAIQSGQQALMLYQQIPDRQGEGHALGNLGVTYQSLGRYPDAIHYYQQSLEIAQEIKNRSGEAATLSNLGIVYDILGNYAKAIEYHEHSLAIAREIKERLTEGNALGNLGNVYLSLGDYPKAIAYQEQSLLIAREIHDRLGEGQVLSSLGIAYFSLNNYSKAIEYQEQSLAIAQEVQDQLMEGQALGNLGNIYFSLGNYAKAITYQEHRLEIVRKIKDRQGESQTLGNLGQAHYFLGNYVKAIAYQEESLAITRELKTPIGETKSLGSLGNIYRALGNYTKAIEYYEQSLAISQKIRDRQGEGQVLGSLGLAYHSLGNYTKAIEYYERRVAIAREINDRDGEYRGLHNLGLTLNRYNQTDLAIIFYKQSIQVAESIRSDNRKLSRDLQASYSETVAGTYRNLADLLLSQGRIGEAQKVLELLKIQEINEITEGTRSATPLTQVPLTQIEQEIIQKHTSLIAFGQQRDTCKQTNCSKLEEYNQTYRNLTAAYDQFIEGVKTQLTQERNAAIAASTDDFTGGARKIVDAQPNTVLIYPLVLQDKTRILWASKGGVLSQTECALGEAQLSKLVEQFRNDLQNSTDLTPVQTTGQQLYQCLLPQKLRNELTQNRITNLVFVPDRVTNYIPMAALYDGKQYLIEQYSISNILSVSLTDTQAKLPEQASVLGFGLSQPVTLRNPTRQFSGLPYVPYELDAIIKSDDKIDSRGVLSGSTWLDRLFTLNNLETQLFQQKPNILHIATHGEFLPTSPKDSYLLLGDGTPYEISKIQYLEDLQNVHLVVLSACETALGGSDRNGLEVAGIASYFLSSNAKAKAVLASLWKVNDPATSLLMAEFYQNLNQGLSKTQALRNVQLKLINSQLTLQDAADRAGARRYIPNQKRPKHLSHPYYWAPFILIGNGL